MHSMKCIPRIHPRLRKRLSPLPALAQRAVQSTCLHIAVGSASVLPWGDGRIVEVSIWMVCGQEWHILHCFYRLSVIEVTKDKIYSRWRMKQRLCCVYRSHGCVNTEQWDSTDMVRNRDACFRGFDASSSRERREAQLQPWQFDPIGKHQYCY